MEKITKQIILDISNNCNHPIDPELDEIYQKYNEQPFSLDDAIYYRFFYQFSQKFPGLNFVELGCKYGHASYFFLKGGGKTALGIDLEDRIKWNLFKQETNTYYFTFVKCSADSEKALELGFLLKPNIIFLDTSHLYQPTKEEFEKWREIIPQNGLIFFDDIARYKMSPSEASSFGCGKFFDELSELEPDNCINLSHLHLGYGFGVWIKRG